MTSRMIWIDVQQYCIRDNEPHELKANDLKKYILRIGDSSFRLTLLLVYLQKWKNVPIGHG